MTDTVSEATRFSPRRIGLPALPDASAALGAAAWLVLATLGPFSRIQDVVLLAVLVLVPIGLSIVDTPRRDGTRSAWYRVAVVAQPPAAAATVGSLWLARGPTAAALATPWLVTTAFVAGFGARRLAERGPWPLGELAVDASLLYLPVGSVALVLDRLGVSLFFEPLIVALTVVHFHYAGFVLPLVAGLAGRVGARGRWGRLLWWTTAFTVVGPAVIAVGISFFPLVEVLAVTAFTTAVALLAVAVVGGVLPNLDGVAQRLLLGIGVLALPVSMGAAVLYGLGEFTGETYVTIGEMVLTHGQLNAYGFALCAMVAWRLAPPTSAVRAPGIRFTRLTADGRVGTDFFNREGLVSDRAASGMIDSLRGYAREGFDPSRARSPARQFFERSGAYELEVVPTWSRLGSALSRLSGPIARRTEQLVLPRKPATGDRALTGEALALDLPGEGPAGRAWVRSNADRVDGPEQLTYVAAYRRYEGPPALLEVIFPLPIGSLTGLLRFEHTEDREGKGEKEGEGKGEREGLTLSSRPIRDNADDAGLYWVVRGFGLRLPLNETITVRSGDGADHLTARHEVSLLGRHLVTLTYEMRPAAE